MPTVITIDRDDEIADLITRVRSVDEKEIGVVLPADAAVFQTPLNVRLLQQFATKDGRTISVITADPRLQQLAKAGGLPVFASENAFSQGLEVVRTHRSEAAEEAALLGAGTATLVAPPVAATAVSPGMSTASPPPPPPPATRRPATVATSGGHRAVYFGAIALGVIGLILFAVLSPSARITVTLNAVPVSVSPTIQGSPDPAEAKQHDHILTQVVTASNSGQFQASPTGQKQLPPVAATGQITLRVANPASPFYAVGTQSTTMKAGTQFQTDDGKIFAVSQDTEFKIPANGAPSGPIPVVAVNAGKAGNVGAHAIDKWVKDPCDANNFPPGSPVPDCQPGDIRPDNAAATANGADATTVAVANDQDVAGWNTQVQQTQKTVTDKINADLLAKGQGRQFATDPSGSGKTLACDVQPPLPKSGDQFAAAKITVSCQAKATLYNPQDVRKIILDELQGQVPAGDSLIQDKLGIPAPSIIQASDDGHMAASDTATGYYAPTVDLDSLKGQVTGKSCDDARKIIEHRIDRVQSVDCHQSALSLPILPFWPGRIEFDLTFNTPATK
jgi:hypothetical protein